MTSRRITEISSDLRIQEALRALDENHNNEISTDEVDRDGDGFVDLTSTSAFWDINMGNQINNDLHRAGIISQRAIRRLEVNGDPAVGNIIFIRQVHDRPEFENPNYRNARLAVGDYQYGILHYLAEHNATEIFGEAYASHHFANGQVNFTNISSNHLCSFPFPINETVRLMLTERGAESVYQNCNGDVNIHPTMNAQEAAELEPIILNPNALSDEDYHTIIMVRREAMATREIMSFLSIRPGVTIYLVYGRRHEFADNFLALANPPQVVSVDFPDLAHAALQAIDQGKVQQAYESFQRIQRYLGTIDQLFTGLASFLKRALNL